MRDTILITFTMLLAVYYFSIPKKLNGLEQVFLGLVSLFVFACLISIFADDLKWWEVNKEHHLVFKVVEIFSKTFISLLIVSYQLSSRRKLHTFLLYLLIFQIITWIYQVFNIVNFNNGWFFYGIIVHSLTLFLLLYLQKKFHHVLRKEGLVDHEGTSTSKII